ncbi:GNAT family N-acetyltransferase [Paenibacillus puldeungensis]|uniref:GNAT family N-acetyltransferase n=1 Tax=Paenibacillus puldeungensis TaxID=696536 RepID=A0ABW3RTV9_9BACL
MTDTDKLIILEPMQAKYNRQVSYLLVHGFRGKFYPLTKLGDNELALFFEKLLDHFPEQNASQRMVAIQEGEVIGTLLVKWKVESGSDDKTVKHQQNSQPEPRLWQAFSSFGKWNVIKMMTGLHLLSHKPQVGEYYIADLSVHPHHQGKGTGKLLLQWAKQYAHSHPSFKFLSLHVSSRNLGAKRLYEQLSFCTHEKERSPLRFLFFREWKWDYMTLEKEPL